MQRDTNRTEKKRIVRENCNITPVLCGILTPKLGPVRVARGLGLVYDSSPTRGVGLGAGLLQELEVETFQRGHGGRGSDQSVRD